MKLLKRVLIGGRRLFGMDIELEKVYPPEDGQSCTAEEKPPKRKKVYDFLRYNRRQIALWIAYLGHDYHGFAIQEQPFATIESCLFEALEKTKMIESRQCNYSRCGRTDKGVSALGQVVSLQVRSSLLEGPGIMVPDGSIAHTRIGDKTKELAYSIILNRNLPDDIRVLGWCPVDSDFSARFNCMSRTYKYYFPLGGLDFETMKIAASHFVGRHDYRNFCKMDISNGVTNFVREILEFDLSRLDNGPASPCQMCVATITGHAFLMHQVRCMMAILFLIGHGLEEDSLIPHMLDLQRSPCKPQYGMASPDPLILFKCKFEGLDWQLEDGAADNVVTSFQRIWTQQAVKTAMVKDMMNSLTSTLTPLNPPILHTAPIVASDHKLGRAYKPLLKRPQAGSFEERYSQHVAKKQRLKVSMGEELASSSDQEKFHQPV